MAIRDRGKMKWASVAFMPEQKELMRELARDELRQAKPLIDTYEFEEFDRQICEAMEFNLPIVVTKWADGFTYEEKGHVHYVDQIQKELRMVAEDGAVLRISMGDIVGVRVL